MYTWATETVSKERERQDRKPLGRERRIVAGDITPKDRKTFQEESLASAHAALIPSALENTAVIFGGRDRVVLEAHQRAYDRRAQAIFERSDAQIDALLRQQAQQRLEDEGIIYDQTAA